MYHPTLPSPETVCKLAKLTQQATRTGSGIQFYYLGSIMLLIFIHSFNKYSFTSTLLGAGNTAENKTNCLNGTYLRV